MRLHRVLLVLVTALHLLGFLGTVHSAFGAAHRSESANSVHVTNRSAPERPVRCVGCTDGQPSVANSNSYGTHGYEASLRRGAPTLKLTSKSRVRVPLPQGQRKAEPWRPIFRHYARPPTFTTFAPTVATNTPEPRPGASYSKMYDGGGGVIAEVDGNGVLNLAIEAAPGSPRGGAMFNDALSQVGPVNGIRGTWNPSMPSNLDAFNANIRAGMSVEQAARATFTGTMAGRSGFTSVTVEQLTGSPGAYTNVKVVFGNE
jgi:hypothetical protein